MAGERRRFDDETRQLALSIAVEVREGLRLLAEASERSGKRDREYSIETIAFADPTIHPLPITTAAAEKVGRFPAEISSLVARLLANTSDFRQKWATIQNALRAGVLTDERLHLRILDAKATTDAMIEAADTLAKSIDHRYGNPRI